MRRYWVLPALALALSLAIVQTGSTFASIIQSSAGSSMAPCPDCDQADCPPVESRAVQCLAHCASETMAMTVPPLVAPPASSERMRSQPPTHESRQALARLAAPSHPPPKRILHRSFQI